jgi:hypothetical protein
MEKRFVNAPFSQKLVSFHYVDAQYETNQEQAAKTLTLTRPRVPTKLTELGQTTFVQPPLFGLFCKAAVNFEFNIVFP